MANKGGNYDKAMSIFSAAKGGNSGGGQRNNTNNSGGNRGSGIGNSGGSNYDKAMSIFSNVKANPAPPQTTGKTPDEVKLSLENKRLDKARNATKEAEKAYNEARIYQKNYGKSGKINEAKEALNQARLNERDIQNEIDINRLVRTATGYEDDKSKKSKIDAARATMLPSKKKSNAIQIPGGGNEAGIRAKEGDFAWQSDSYKAMTDDEAEVYNRLAKNGKEKEAEAFLKAITPTLNARVTQNRLESAQKTARDGVMGGVGASIASSLLKPVTALQGGIKTVWDFATGKPIDTNAPEYYASNLANTLRSSVAEKIENGVYESTKGDYTYDRTGTRRMTTEGEAKNNGKIASFLYQTGMSMADMLTMTPFGPVGMQVMMSSNAGVDTMIDAKNNGATDDQAMALGIVSGAAEALFEKFSIENLFHGGVSKSTILAALKQGGIEASEEMATEITNILANEAIMGNQSDFKKAVAEYKEMGLDDKDAKAKALEEKLLQVLEAGAGGFLSGFGMGAAADVMNTQSAGAALINDYANTIAEGMDINTYLEQGMSETEANRARLADAKKQAIQELSAELQSEGAELEKGTVANRLSNKAYTSESGIGRQFLANTEGMRLSSGKRADTDNDLTNVTPATREAAKSLDMLDKSNIARYINEITAALDRSAATGKKILIGKPSGILVEQMNSDNVLQMDQSVARKVAFADKKDGGKHNLGRGVLDELPYQLADPMIITGNTTDHISKGDTNSVVVWTDWQTENGDSVIVPIRIDVDGAIEPYNSVNSVFDAYNPAYVADLLRDENIRYTRNNKSVEELLSNRRQVPAATRSVDASDTEGLLSNGREVPAATRTSDVNNTVSQESVHVKEYLANLRKPTAQETLAAIADDPTKAEEQLSLSEKEQNFAKNLSQAAQNLNMVNAETKALGREYYTHSEEMPSLQDIQKKNIEDFTSEDFSVLAKNLLGSGKQRLYTKEPSRVFDTVAGNNKTLRNTLYNLFEKPFNEAGGNYGKSLTSSVESYKEIMRKYDIKPKSKEDIAAQRYGEGQYQGPDGEMIEYTLADLQRDCPDTWENVKGFAEANRRVYEDYLNRINSIMETIYPNILENAEEEYQTAVSRRDVAQSKVDAMTRAITEKQNRIQRLQDTRSNKQRTDTKAFAKIEGSIAAEQAKVDSMKTELVQLEKKLRVAEMNAQAQRAAIDSGAIYEGKRIIPRKDYFHHTQEMLSDYSVLDFLRPKNVTEDVSPALAGVSDQTKPKSRWWGAMFHRGQGAYFESASNAMASYIGMAEYKLAYDPLTNYYRKLETTIRGSADIINAKNASGFIEWVKDWTDGMSGKSDHVIDRGVQKILSRQTLNSLNNLNKRVRANKVMGNIRTMIVQASNLPNAMSYVTSPKAWAQGIQMLADYHHNPDSEIAKARGQSQFMTQRYGSNAMEILESDGLSAKKLAGKGMELLQHWGDELTWFSAFAQYNENPQAAMSGMKRTYDNAIDYADDITRRSVAGRGVGEGALVNNSKVVNLLAPFQTEVLNQWNTFFEHVKDLKASPQARARAAAGLAMYEVTAFAFNTLAQAVLGDKVLGLDFIGALVDTITNAINDDDEDEEKGALDYAKELGQASLGTVVDAAPFINIITSFMGDETSKDLFGEHSPTRYGTGNIGIRAAADAMMWGKDTVKTLIDMAGGKATTKDLDWEGGLEAAGNFVTPWGGTQLARTVKGLDTFFRGGKYDKKGNLQYAVAKTPVNFLRAATLGRSILPEHQEWIAKGFPKLTPEQTKAYGEFKKAGGDITAFTDFKAKYDELKNSIGADNKEISKLADEIEAANPMLSEAQAKERAQNQLGKKYRNADNEYLTLVAESDMTDEQKLAAMMAIGMSDDDINKVKGLVKNGVTVGEYLKYQNLYSSRGSTKTEDKNALVSALMADKTLSEKDKTMLANRIIDGDWVVDFSSQAANDILTQHGKSSYNKYQKAKTEAGISAETYLSYANKSDNFISDYDQYGTSISYSKKAKVVDYLEKIDASEEQKEYMFHELFGYTSSYQARFKKLKEIDGVWCYEHNGEWIRPTY